MNFQKHIHVEHCVLKDSKIWQTTPSNFYHVTLHNATFKNYYATIPQYTTFTSGINFNMIQVLHTSILHICGVYSLRQSSTFTLLFDSVLCECCVIAISFETVITTTLSWYVYFLWIGKFTHFYQNIHVIFSCRSPSLWQLGSVIGHRFQP